ncbi:MAG: phosphotransacetylase family protein [Synechococcus sp.]|nr:phosphotransacetylase family protein [Synechococcus sp.]
MTNSTQCIVVASTEPYSGKSAVLLGLVHSLREQGISVAYSKPIGTVWHDEQDGRFTRVEDDLRFLGEAFGLKEMEVRSPVLFLDEATVTQRLTGQDKTDYPQKLKDDLAGIRSDVTFIEAPNSLWEGSLFNLSAGEIAATLDAQILLVIPYHPQLLIDSLLTVYRFLGDRLMGVVINKIPPEALETAETQIKPFLAQRGIDVYGMVPADRILRSVTVRELVKRLNAEVLCRANRLDLMVESLTIGAMNVNSALKYFRQRQNMAVVTGGDRTDLQLAALETSTQCLILTGHVAPQEIILNRAEDLEIPILSVDYDTLTTVEIIDQAFDHVRLQEPIKVEVAQALCQKHFDFERFKAQLSPAIA